MLNDKCVKSCAILLAQCNNTNITTVEGLGKTEKLHKIQESFKNNHGLQCGFVHLNFILSIRTFKR